MRYIRASAESEPEYGEGTFYFEIDADNDGVVRQVEIYERAIFCGRWTGAALEGYICDQKASAMGLTESQAIPAEAFQVAWHLAQASPRRFPRFDLFDKMNSGEST
jgi:hypothetical protein